MLFLWTYILYPHPSGSCVVQKTSGKRFFTAARLPEGRAIGIWRSKKCLCWHFFMGVHPVLPPFGRLRREKMPVLAFFFASESSTMMILLLPN